MLFQYTNLSFDRHILDYTKVQLLYGNVIRNRRYQVAQLAGATKSYLNVGCGPNADNRFINLDYQWRPGVDLCWDITKGIPLEANSITGIYSEHCLEHITFEQAQAALVEFYRLLKPGGNIRVIVPDAELYIDLYTRSKHGETVEFPYVSDAESKEEFSPIMSVNRVFRSHGHLYAYDFECLALMLRKAGFEKIEKASFRSGREPVLLIDSESRRIESVYVEATKVA